MLINNMGNGQHPRALNYANRQPSFLAVFDAVLLYQSVGIDENTSCCFEAHTMLASVARCLRKIPLEAELHLIMLLQICCFPVRT